MSSKKNTKKLLTGTKALVMGIGLHGGGVATIKWLAKNGAVVTGTDMRSKKVLTPTLSLLRGVKARYVLGEHREEDFRTHDLIVVNPAVPRESPYLKSAHNAGKRIENVASLFFRALENPAIAVTGTRGKTTTTLWVAELLQKKYKGVRQSGTPDNALLDEFERIGKLPKKIRAKTPVVTELSSWQLEYLPVGGRAPHIAAITNIYPEHLNRYRDIRDYADAKANIFTDQTKDDMLVLNHDNSWHKYFTEKKPKSSLYYISQRKLPRKLRGAYVDKDMLTLRIDGVDTKLFSVTRFRRTHGTHNVENLMRAILLVALFDPTIKITEKDVSQLSSPRMRQETIYRKGGLLIVNDSCATSPDGTEAALERFRREGRIVLILGGTDKKLEFASLARKIKAIVKIEDLILLSGSATEKIENALVKVGYNIFQEFEALEDCVTMALSRARAKKRGKVVVLFSPASASFEKFLHEFDRGEQFNALIAKKMRSSSM